MRKIKIGRVIIALVIYFVIGTIPIRLSHIQVDRAKSKFAMELLTADRYYPAEIRAILKKAADDPSYARNHIHVWDPDGRGKRPYDSYISGGKKWLEKGYIIPKTGDEVAKTIIDNENTSLFLYFLSVIWYLGVPFSLMYLLAKDDLDQEQSNTHYSTY